MKEIINKLYKLLQDELYDLNMGHNFNEQRLKSIKWLCHLIVYCKYVNLSDIDLIKMMHFYD